MSATESQVLPVFPASNSLYRAVFKRVLDVDLTLAAMPFLIPFFLVVGALIALDGHSPLFLPPRT